MRLAVRPTAVKVFPENELEGQAKQEALKGEIRVASFLGDHMDYEVDTKAGFLYAIAGNASTVVSAGQRVLVGIRQTDLALLPQEAKVSVLPELNMG